MSALAQAQARTEDRLEELAQAQARTEARLEELAQQMSALAQAQARTEDRLEELAQAQARTEARLEELAQQMSALAQAQARTEDRLEELAQAQARTEARLEELAQQMSALAQAQARTEDRLEELIKWQRGEAGLREGERYEQSIARRAGVLFNGGQGGIPGQPMVYQHLLGLLQRLPNLAHLPEEQDPFMADLIWWKNDQYAVVEVSIQVNSNDVDRAALRAKTLREVNVQAIGMVIGKEWANQMARERAVVRGVEWRVGDDLSEGYLAFCR